MQLIERKVAPDRAVSVCQAMRVGTVGQHFDNPAAGDLAARALRDHPLEFRLKCLQSSYAPLHSAQLPAGNFVGDGTGPVRRIRQAQQFADRFQRKAKFTAMTNECQPSKMLGAIAPLVASRSKRLRHQSDLLVVPDGLNLAAGLRRKLSNRKFPLFHEETAS